METSVEDRRLALLEELEALEAIYEDHFCQLSARTDESTTRFQIRLPEWDGALEFTCASSYPEKPPEVRALFRGHDERERTAQKVIRRELGA